MVLILAPLTHTCLSLCWTVTLCGGDELTASILLMSRSPRCRTWKAFASQATAKQFKSRRKIRFCHLAEEQNITSYRPLQLFIPSSRFRKGFRSEPTPSLAGGVRGTWGRDHEELRRQNLIRPPESLGEPTPVPSFLLRRNKTNYPGVTDLEYLLTLISTYI